MLQTINCLQQLVNRKGELKGECVTKWCQLVLGTRLVLISIVPGIIAGFHHNKVSIKDEEIKPAISFRRVGIVQILLADNLRFEDEKFVYQFRIKFQFGLTFNNKMQNHFYKFAKTISYCIISQILLKLKFYKARQHCFALVDNVSSSFANYCNTHLLLAKPIGSGICLGIALYYKLKTRSVQLGGRRLQKILHKDKISEYFVIFTIIFDTGARKEFMYVV